MPKKKDRWQSGKPAKMSNQQKKDQGEFARFVLDNQKAIINLVHLIISHHQMLQKHLLEDLGVCPPDLIEWIWTMLKAWLGL